MATPGGVVNLDEYLTRFASGALAPGTGWSQRGEDQFKSHAAAELERLYNDARYQFSCGPRPRIFIRLDNANHIWSVELEDIPF